MKVKFSKTKPTLLSAKGFLFLFNGNLSKIFLCLLSEHYDPGSFRKRLNCAVPPLTSF